MPIMDGLEATKLIQKIFENKEEKKVIYKSSSSSNENL